jgi:hypothetical protein
MPGAPKSVEGVAINRSRSTDSSIYRRSTPKGMFN